LYQEHSSSYKSFPESKHVSTALQVIQDSLASPSGYSSNNTGKVSGFGPSSFPVRLRSKNFEIHGKSAPTCDKTNASLLGSKSVDGLRLTRSLWSKSENLHRSTSHALDTAEHFLSAAGSLLQERGDDFSELKSFLLQVDQAIGITTSFNGTLGNFTLSKRSDFVEKSSVNESLKDSLLSSPLSEKIFGLSLQEVQEEKKRKVDPPTTSSASKPNFSHKIKWAKMTGNRK
jgi:hypothetical protein